MPMMLTQTHSIVKYANDKKYSIQCQSLRKISKKSKSNKKNLVYRCVLDHRDHLHLEDLVPLPANRLHHICSLTGLRVASFLVLRHVRVGVFLLVQISQCMVHLAMLCLISTNVQKEILHRAVALVHVPVLNSDLGCRHGRPLGQPTSLDILDSSGVCNHSLFFEVTNKAVTGAWRDEVGEKEAVEEDTLGAEDHQAHEPAGFGHLHE